VRAVSESTVPSAATKSSGNWKWYLLLLLPFIGLLWLPFYAKAEPRLWGIPFFYWYQFLWVFITMALTELVYRRTQ
jgi:Protein of unknown function (DUF3311)